MASDILMAAGQFESGQSQEQAAEFNAKISEQNAAQSRLAAAQEERISRIQARKQIGSMRAAYGASGVTMDGSPMEVLAESAAMAELDALNIRHAGETKARGFEFEAASSRYAGAQARISSRIGAAASLMKAGEKMAAKVSSGGMSSGG